MVRINVLCSRNRMCKGPVVGVGKEVKKAIGTRIQGARRKVA